MVEEFKETKTIGYTTRIKQSLKLAILGIILFLGSFALLYWNEGRTDLSKIASKAIEVDSSKITTDQTLQGKLVFVTGRVETEEEIGDNLFLKPDKFIALKRTVEMYAWVEKRETKSKTNVGGSETRETTYRYYKQWTENPPSASSFKYPEGHTNPEKTLESEYFYAKEAKIGAYYFNPQNIILPQLRKLFLSPEKLVLNENVVLANDTYLFIKNSPNGTFENPQIGDLRISYSALPSGFQGTIFGQLKDDRIEPYFYKDNRPIYRLFLGTRNEAVAKLRSEHVTSIWIFRFLGFFMMWTGLLLCFGPISVLLDILPIFGTLSRIIVGIFTFLVTLSLTLVTILISKILHNIFSLIFASLVTIALSLFLLKKIVKKRKMSIPQSPVS